MYLVAQRVRVISGSVGLREGINAFCYLHGSFTWTGPAPSVLDRDGVLVNSEVQVQPPGNRVRSYLDIFTPDAIPTPTLIQQATSALASAAQGPVPWRAWNGQTTVEFGAEHALALTWQDEFQSLLLAAIHVRRHE